VDRKQAGDDVLSVAETLGRHRMKRESKVPVNFQGFRKRYVCFLFFGFEFNRRPITGVARAVNRCSAPRWYGKVCIGEGGASDAGVNS